jgi:hypothetical protein
MLIQSSPDCPTTWAQEGIKFDPAPDVVDLGGRKIELIYVGDTACTVDCSSSGHRPFAMSVREYEVNLSLRSLDSLDADAGFDLNPDAPACFPCSKRLHRYPAPGGSWGSISTTVTFTRARA